MLNANFIPARQLQKTYKSIINGVKTKNEVVVLTTSGEPQAAIVSLADLARLQQSKANQVSLEILQLASDNREELKKLPSNLRKRANEILYSK